MAWKVLTFFGIALLGLSDARPPTSEQKVKIESYGKLSHVGSQKPEHHEVYAWSYPSYEFSYEVADPHTHDFKGHHETRNGDEVKGYYWLIQPDGLKRTVKYRADKNSGFKAHVDYAKYYKSSKENNNEDETNGDEGGMEENSNNNGENNEGEQEENAENENNSNENNEESELAENVGGGNGNVASAGEEGNQEESGVNMEELEEISRNNNSGEQNARNGGRGDERGERRRDRGGELRGRGQSGQNEQNERNGNNIGGIQRQDSWRRGGVNFWGQRRRTAERSRANDQNEETVQGVGDNENNENEGGVAPVEENESEENNNNDNDNDEQNGGSEENGENGNNNEEGAVVENNSESRNKYRIKHEYHVIIHHPKYLSKSKKIKRRI